MLTQPRHILAIITHPPGETIPAHAVEPSPSRASEAREAYHGPATAQHDDGQDEGHHREQVVVVKEPARMGDGGIGAVVDDTCGNLLNLQD